ncbi:MAG: hypothetical protein AB9888_08100 [Bacteroidales bacterium]
MWKFSKIRNIIYLDELVKNTYISRKGDKNMDPKKYSDEQLEKAYLSLSDDQKEVLDEHVKRGKKTKWLNIWAKKIGESVSEAELDDADEWMDQHLEWILVDYEDSLKVNPNTKCECGRSLRYRYTVKQNSTGIIYKLGLEHFKQHTGLSPDLVRDISKGLKAIDLERDEILTKAIDNWILPFEIHYEIEIPKDMQEQIRVNLPLLERQVTRLSKIIFNYRHPIMKQNANKQVHNKFQSITQIQKEESKPSLDLSSINPNVLYSKLKSATISSAEAWEFYQFIRCRSARLKDYGLDLDEIKKYVNIALGKIGNQNIRKWLVEIEYFYD